MLKDDEIDTVFILTSGSHAPIAIAAAKAGKHVLVEKPMCFSVAEGLEMKSAADAAGVTLMVASTGCRQIVGFDQETPGRRDAGIDVEADAYVSSIGHWRFADRGCEGQRRDLRRLHNSDVIREAGHCLRIVFSMAQGC